MLAVPITNDVLAEAEEDVDGNAKELAFTLIGMGTSDIGSGSSSLGFAAAGGSLAVGRTACEETSKWHRSESYSLPTTVTTSVTSIEKEVVLNPYKNSYASAYTTASTKTHDSKKTPGSYSTIPLPPSLSSSYSPKSPVQEYSIDMTSEANLVQTHASYDTSPQSARQVPYSLQSVSSTNKYNRELTINPLFSSKSDYVKYKS
ncbi:hypothetical protein AVEN_60241-1 [Araneus ventricosus]|uniref:Uncharacterized protein n=1 Tax=Araneus ventricosus TaxID=182803 RepID=A0A4Y2CMT9_ARAVE|nr:hypothetical protein AVEN_60241-1 [Araneus ventricosus]